LGLGAYRVVGIRCGCAVWLFWSCGVVVVFVAGQFFFGWSAGMRGMNMRVLCRRQGFSLVEMLLVIAVIALLIAMLLPALAGARDSAMKVQTQSMMADLTNAAQRFGNDNAGRNPGYFSESDMGHSENLAIGMSAMENAMIDLGGTAVVLGEENDPVAAGLINIDRRVISIGPRSDGSAASRVVVNVNAIGAEGAYFVPDQSFWKAQVHDGSNGAGQAGNAAGTGQALMPDLVDAWGNPVLVWAQDPTARGSIVPSSDADEVYAQFARVRSDGPGAPGGFAGPAWFYLNSNAAFLEARSYGDSGIDMRADPRTGRASVLGSGVGNNRERMRTLAAVLASPSSFQLDPTVTGLDEAIFTQVYPSAPRGRFIVHSAGSDGVIMGSNDEGWKSSAVNSGGDFRLDFGNNYLSQDNARLTDDNGAFTNIDMVVSFDDLLIGGK